MLDFHTHILPGIDDGSKDIETSCKMLDMLKEQNVDIVVATPHFYYDIMNFDKVIYDDYKKIDKLNIKDLNKIIKEINLDNKTTYIVKPWFII